MSRTRHVYVSDLDGTLLRTDGSLSARSRDLLNRALDAGIEFSVASARSVHSIRPLLDGVRVSLPIIEFNGAFITDLQTARHDVVHAIDPTLVGELFDLIARDSVPPIVAAYDGRRDSIYRSPILNEGITSYLDGRRAASDPRLRPPTDPRDHLDEQVVCLTAIDRPERLDPLAARLAHEYGDRVQIHCFADYYFHGWHWLTVHDANATKANALQDILRRLDLEARRLVVFGDQVNDLSMFELAGRSIAVSNAVDSVREQAHETIGSNQTDSVAEYVLRHSGV